MTQSENIEIVGRERPKKFFTAVAGWLLVLPAAAIVAGGTLIFAVHQLIVG